MLHNHNGLLARPDSRHLRRLLDSPLPAHRWQSQTHGGVLVPKEVNIPHNSLSLLAISCEIEDGRFLLCSNKHGKGVPDIWHPVIYDCMVCFMLKELDTYDTWGKVYCMDRGRGKGFC